MVQVKKLDFSGQTIFCDVDVHMKSWNVCLRNDAMELVNFSQPASSQTLANYLKKNYPKANFKVTYEAGFCGFHIQRSLEKLGIDCIVAHPADVPTTDKEKQRKLSGVIKRSDFNFAPQAASSMLSDEVTIAANGEFAKTN